MAKKVMPLEQFVKGTENLHRLFVDPDDVLELDPDYLEDESDEEPDDEDPDED